MFSRCRTLSPLILGVCVVPLMLSGCQTVADPSLPAPREPSAFVTWETPPINPLAISPSGELLFAAHTPDNRLVIFDISQGIPIELDSVPVGLDPVSVRARTNDEVWVVNQISDSVSIVHVPTRHVTRTLLVGDEPSDVVFASGRAFVSCSQINEVWAYDLQQLDLPPQKIAIAGHYPRTLDVSPDGTRVFAAILESGNGTTILGPEMVSNRAGPYAGKNPPPNRGDEMSPPMPEGMPRPPRVSHIVKKNATFGEWRDDNKKVWPKSIIKWDLHDHDVAMIDSSSLAVEYVSVLMNMDQHVAMRADGMLTVIGTEATNEVRFEPNLTGRFVRSVAAIVDPYEPSRRRIVDLNPHLKDAYDDRLTSVSRELRDISIADPRGIVWTADASVGYVSGLGSNNVIRIDAKGRRTGQLDAGQGPSGLALDETRARLYVLNRFDSTISAIDTGEFSQVAHVPMFDPTPSVIRAGRPLLYDARQFSGLGVTSCASCHVDAKMDQIAWDLGDPAGELKPFDQFCDDVGGLVQDGCRDFHPMKGPMVTQTLQGIIGVEPLHWRGDRADLGQFAPAFVGLMGADSMPAQERMQAFADFLAQVRFPPNPYRRIDGSLPERVGDGDPIAGEEVYNNGLADRQLFNCVRCHTMPVGSDQTITPARALTLTQSFKVPPLNNQYRKRGFTKGSAPADRGFGFVHDGRNTDLVEFLSQSVFSFAAGAKGQQQRRDVEAFIFAFGTDTHAGVGQQITLNAPVARDSDGAAVNEASRRVAEFQTTADRRDCGLVIKGIVGGIPRGYAYVGEGMLQSDRAAELVALDQVLAGAGAGRELSLTLTPPGSEFRIGVDRDMDGMLDQDERDAGRDPSFPDGAQPPADAMPAMRVVVPGITPIRTRVAGRVSAVPESAALRGH